MGVATSKLTFGRLGRELGVEVEGVVHHPGDGRFEGRLQFPRHQGVPVDGREERVLLDLLDAATCNTCSVCVQGEERERNKRR